MDILVGVDGILAWGARRHPCVLGVGGVKRDKREGDGATPVGQFALRRVLYRADRLARPKTVLPVAALDPCDAWCDDPADPLYNRQVRRPCTARIESLWRADGVYDVIVVLGYNDQPVVPGLGSAIFLHVAQPDRAPTRGCVALERAHLLTILAACTADTRLIVAAPAAG